MAYTQVPSAARVGLLFTASARSDPVIDGLRQGLRNGGYAEGRNLQIEFRSAEGDASRLEQLVRDLLAKKIEVIVANGSAAAFAAKRVTTVIPIVFTAVSDPVALGLVHSMARPEANVTGISGVRDAAVGKELELLKQVAPSIKTVTLVSGPIDPASKLNLQNIRIAAQTLELKSQILEIKDPSSIESSLGRIARGRGHAIFLVPNPWIFTYRSRIVELATKRHNPTVGWQSALAESGALLSYGASNFEIGQLAAAQVVRLLAGKSPSDVPIEEPTKFELVVNLRTAKALGLTMPKDILTRADRLIH